MPSPCREQIQRWWSEVTTALAEPIAQGLFKKNETWHTIELPGTEQRLRAKTAFNADTLRGDFATRLILDEFSFYERETPESVVGAPMMLDRPGVHFCLRIHPAFLPYGWHIKGP